MRRVVLPALLLSLVLVAPAAASTLTVTTTADSGPGSLRATIAGSGSGDTVVIPAGTYNLTSGEIDPPHGLTIAGAGVGTTTISGTHHSRIFTFGGGPTTVQDLTLTDGSATSGGAIESSEALTLARVVLTANSSSGYGGAIDSNGSLSLTDVALTTNSGSYGGAIEQSGPISLDRVLIAGNTASQSDGAMDLSEVGATTFVNTTIANNTGSNGYGGWEVSNSVPYAVITLQNDTIVGNRALGTGTIGGFRVGSFQAVKLINTIVAGNTTPTGTLNCYQAGAATITSLGHNIDDTTGSTDACALTAAGDQPGIAPGLGALGDHGGPTQTMLPAPGGPAVDHGDGASCPATDARGVPRPLGAGCDVGAVELATPSAVTGAPLDVTTTTATLTGTVNPFTLGGTYGFEFGPTSAYGTTTALTAFAASATAVPVSMAITGLSPGTTYHARLDAVTGDGSAPGADVTFTTAAVPSVHVLQCVVPKLKGLSLKKARTRLSAAHCKLGKVRRPKHAAKHAKLVVSKQSPAKGKHLKAGAKVSVALAVKR